MIAYFRIRKALAIFQKTIKDIGIHCSVKNANNSVFRVNNLFAYVKVNTDQEKEKLISQISLNKEFKASLIEAGIDQKVAEKLSVVVESQETVDRVWNGNWFYALFK